MRKVNCWMGSTLCTVSEPSPSPLCLFPLKEFLRDLLSRDSEGRGGRKEWVTFSLTFIKREMVKEAAFPFRFFRKSN